MNAIRVRATYVPDRQVHDVAVHARAQSPGRSLARGGPGEVRVDRRRRADGDGARASSRRSRARATTNPRRARSRASSAAQLHAALAALPPEQRDAFLLQYEGGLSLAEIAELTGVGMETVKSRLRYAVAKLRNALGPLREAWS